MLVLWRRVKLGARAGGSRGALILCRTIRTSSKMVSLRKHLSEGLKELRSETWAYLRDLCRQRGQTEEMHGRSSMSEGERSESQGPELGSDHE